MGAETRIDAGELSSNCIGALEGEAIEYVDEVEGLLMERDADLEKLVAISHVKRAVR